LYSASRPLKNKHIRLKGENMLVALIVQLLMAVSWVVMGAMIGYMIISKKRIRWVALSMAVLGIVPTVLHCIFTIVSLTLISTAIYLIVSIPMLLSAKKFIQKSNR
jgi:surface polysaccharide O-acyltransferase-like enzyme